MALEGCCGAAVADVYRPARRCVLALSGGAGVLWRALQARTGVERDQCGNLALVFAMSWGGSILMATDVVPLGL